MNEIQNHVKFIATGEIEKLVCLKLRSMALCHPQSIDLIMQVEWLYYFFSSTLLIANRHLHKAAFYLNIFFIEGISLPRKFSMDMKEFRFYVWHGIKISFARIIFHVVRFEKCFLCLWHFCRPKMNGRQKWILRVTSICSSYFSCELRFFFLSFRFVFIYWISPI